MEGCQLESKAEVHQVVAMKEGSKIQTLMERKKKQAAGIQKWTPECGVNCGGGVKEVV